MTTKTIVVSETPVTYARDRTGVVQERRIEIYSDQLHMALSLMSEDVKTVEDTLSDPLTAFWREQLEEGFEERRDEVLPRGHARNCERRAEGSVHRVRRLRVRRDRRADARSGWYRPR